MAETTDAEGQGIPEKELLIFKPTEATREIYRRMADEAMLKAMDQFFALWIEQTDPREAGSVIAHAFMQTAARIAVFGAMCGHHEPSIAQWMECCRERFDEALIAATMAFDTADQQGDEACQQPDKSGS